MANLLNDLRFALRQLRRSPGLAVVAVITLALAICANTAIFSLLDQALLRVLPVRNPQQLVVLNFTGDTTGHVHTHGGDTPGHKYYFTYPDYLDLRSDNNGAFSDVFAADPADVGVTWNNRSEEVPLEMVSGNYFTALGVKPAVGRLLSASDETARNANPVAVLNFDYWRTHLGEAPVVGKTLRINGKPFTILGVTAPGFHTALWGNLPDLYVPLTMKDAVTPEWIDLMKRDSYFLNIMARLRPGVSAADAASRLQARWHAIRAVDFSILTDRTAGDRRGFLDRARLNVEPAARGFSPMRDELRTPLLIILAMVVLMAGMAIVNVASLLLVRAAMRQREFSMRYALGATSAMVLRQLLVEGLLLGGAGALLGVALAEPALRFLVAWMAGRTPDTVFTASLDLRVLGFTLAVTVAASLLFSFAPAMQFLNPNLVGALKQQMGTGSGGALNFRRTCVMLQIGFSLLLIVGAGLFVRTLGNLRAVNPGFATDHLLTFRLSPADVGYTSAGIHPVEEQVLSALAALPGVRGVGATNDRELSDSNRDGDVVVSGGIAPKDEDYNVELPWVSSGYLQTLGIPLVAGRYFTDADSAAAAKVAVVNELFAKHYFGTAEKALGHQVGRPTRPQTNAMIVGVVANARHSTVRDLPTATAYVPFVQQDQPGALQFYVRTWQSPDAAATAVRAAVAGVDAKLVLADLSTLRDQIDDTISYERTVALLASLFGVLATLLAGIGLYGILAYSTAQRTREIGIRMALGSQRFAVMRLILREVLLLAGAATAVTVPLAMLATRTVRSQLYGVTAVNAEVYAAGVAIIAAVALLSALLPALRAASIDPAKALRNE